MTPEIRFTPEQVVDALNLGYKPNEQQVKAISASYTSPTLVVAGAGSGKTELMALRVPWLVANRLARPEQILGLTFTRKAAAQLNNRVNEYLRALRDNAKEADMWPQELGDEYTPPTIATYNSYATSIFRDFALQLGYDNDAVQLTDATAYQFARQLLNTKGAQIDERLLDEDFKVSTLADHVIKLAAAMNENEVSAAEIEAHLQQYLDKIIPMPKSKQQRNDYQAEVVETMDAFERNKIIARLAEAFLEAKIEHSRIDYSDQVALAKKAVTELGSLVVDREQERYTQILLDEYQDTSVLQTRLLAGLFKDKSVIAVGDPHQSIYGWRGASASNLAEFQRDFISPDAQGNAKPFQALQLSVSWRNPQKVLDLANDVAKVLDVPLDYISADQRRLLATVKREPLSVRPDAGDGSVDFYYGQTLDDETAHVAKWLKERMARVRTNKKGQLEVPTGAVILRKRKHIRPFADALMAAGVDVEVVGLGGLLEMPEITDIRAALAVLVQPEAGTELIRLLTGARWQVGLKDIDGLYRFAKRRSYNDEDRDIEGKSDESNLSIVDALDALRSPKASTGLVVSEEGRARLEDAAATFDRMRSRLGLPLPELIRAIVSELWIDVELYANPTRKYPMMHINEFINVVNNYCEGNDDPNITMLLEYLEHAADRERLDVPPTAIREGVVQIITIHASKGLEWDYVALGAFNQDDLPNKPRSRKGWLSVGQMPYALRGDHASLPEFQVEPAQDQKELVAQIDHFKEVDVAEMLKEEERRLAYVAITRAKLELSISGAYWEPGAATAKQPSEFLFDGFKSLSYDGDFLIPNAEIPVRESDENPVDKDSLVETWPKPVFSPTREAQVENAKASFLAATVEAASSAKGVESKYLRLGEQIDMLLSEDQVRQKSARVVDFPVRIPASNFKAFLGELEFVAGSFLRPVPSEPYGASRRGNLFHAWVERSNSPIGLVDNDEDLPELEDEDDFIEVEQLQENFKYSRFAKMQPVALEQEVQLTIGSNTFICKMDAVYADGDGFEIVDWKTNTPPVAGSEDEAKRALQLSLYRFAYSEFTGVPLEKIKATFYFVGADEELSPAHLADRAEILAKWQEVLDKVAEGAAAEEAEGSSKN